MPGLCHFVRSVPNRELAALANEPNKVWVGDNRQRIRSSIGYTTPEQYEYRLARFMSA